MKVSAPGLAGWLAIVTALLVTVAVAAVSIAGIRLLRDLAGAEALTRVELAVAAAREELRQTTDSLLTAALVLGERPTLQALLRAAPADVLGPYLTRYCEGAAVDGCAVVRDGEPLATMGDSIDWPHVLAASGSQGPRFLIGGVRQGAPFAGARAGVPGSAGHVVVTVTRLDAAFAAGMTERIGLEIQVVAAANRRDDADPLTGLHTEALVRGAAAAARIESINGYAASLPVTGPTGEVTALLLAILPAADVMGPVAGMQRRMLLIAVAVAFLATSGGILIGRYWIDGVRRLTAAARRIGAGDLAAAVPDEGQAELGVLARAMEEMRRNLIELTDEIRRREAQAQAVLGGIVEGVFAVDRKRRIRFLNPQAEKLLKTATAEAFGRFCGDVLQPARDAEGRRPCEHACPIIAARDAGAAEAVEHLRPADGRERRVVIASAAASDGIQVQVLRDETELQAARRARDTVLANISHEFRTPLAAQLASIELLRDGIGTTTVAAQRQLVASLERGVQRLTWLIDNLLESVRIESGQLGIRQHQVALGDVIQGARDLIEPLLDQREQRMTVRLPAHLPVIRGDRQRLVQVLVNLLANASKFGPAGTVIRIGAKALDDGIAFWVDDEGPGPADPDEPRIFEPFHRSGGDDPAESGLGLGLFIVNSIVERHGGRVRLERTGDRRTRVQVELPGNRQA